MDFICVIYIYIYIYIMKHFHGNENLYFGHQYVSIS